MRVCWKRLFAIGLPPPLSVLPNVYLVEAIFMTTCQQMTWQLSCKLAVDEGFCRSGSALYGSDYMFSENIDPDAFLLLWQNWFRFLGSQIILFWRRPSRKSFVQRLELLLSEEGRNAITALNMIMNKAILWLSINRVLEEDEILCRLFQA